jgi:glutamate-1-semialdehyde 2,1-aminomutase
MSRAFSGSSELFREAVRRIPGGVNSPVRAFGKVGGEPIYIARASGSRFLDVDGNEFVDFCQSWGPLILGHARPEVVEAVREAAGEGLSYGACHRREIELAELVLEAFPEHEKVRAVSSGTEAVMTALRVARGATGRPFVLKFEGGYHGHFDGMLVRAGSGLATQAIADSDGIPPDIAQTTLVARFDDEEGVARIFEERGRDIAAVIVEPMPANNGLLLQRNEFLSFLREITRRHGALLIFDEVISGFRLGFGGYGHLVGVTPDLTTLGKIIGGGMPVGAVAGPAALMDLLSPSGAVYQAGTLSGNPVSLAAGIATLRLLRETDPWPELEERGRRFVKILEESGLPHARARQAGSVLWLHLDPGPFPRRADAISARAMERFDRMYWRLIDRGYYLPPSSYEVFFLSTAHSDAEVEGLAEAVVAELAAEGTP